VDVIGTPDFGPAVNAPVGMNASTNSYKYSSSQYMKAPTDVSVGAGCQKECPKEFYALTK